MKRSKFREFSLEFFEEAHNLGEKKNADYATGGDENADALANFRLLEHMAAGRTIIIPPHKQAAFGAFMRLLDKVSRMFQFLAFDHKAQVADEVFHDVCIDMANYSKIIDCLAKTLESLLKGDEAIEGCRRTAEIPLRNKVYGEPPFITKYDSSEDTELPKTQKAKVFKKPKRSKKTR